ncbi:MAG: hypothetical protein ACI8T1_002230 [Verrucomicrobiales bacterium]|jgi:hypothetical protein
MRLVMVVNVTARVRVFVFMFIFGLFLCSGDPLLDMKQETTST